MLGTLLIAGAGLLVIAIALLILWLTAPREEDYYTSYLALMALTTVQRTSPASRMVIGGSPTGDGADNGAAAFSIPVRALRGERPAAPLDNDRRGGIRLIVNR